MNSRTTPFHYSSSIFLHPLRHHRLPRSTPSKFLLLLGLLCLLAIILCILLPWPSIFLPAFQSGKFAATLSASSSNDGTHPSNWHHHLGQQSANLPPLSSPALRAAFGHRLWSQLSRLNCSRLASADPKYVQQARRHRIVQRDPDKLAMDCALVRARWKFAESPASEEEAKFPIAFARTVFRDYLLLEQMLSTEYAPQNAYCYSLDAKASGKFKGRIRALARCFPAANVFVADKEFSVFSNGKNVSRSHLACLRVLEESGRDWKYALLLQNHDIPLRTNAEMVQILSAYNGTNEVGTRKIVAISVNRTLDWSIHSLGLYRNESQIPPGLDRLRHTKSLNLIALSRAAVQFSLNQLNLDPLIDQLERSRYGMDEVLFSTLNSNLPDFPGGFTTDCLLKQNRSTQSMGRYTIWRNYGTQTGRCLSDHFRHDLCIYGAEDLAHIGRATLHFYLNKMLPSFDYGAIFCWLSSLAARGQATQGQVPNVNTGFYRQLLHVRYNRLRAEDHDQFEC